MYRGHVFELQVDERAVVEQLALKAALSQGREAKALEGAVQVRWVDALPMP